MALSRPAFFLFSLWTLALPANLFSQTAVYVSDGARGLRLVRKLDYRAPYFLADGKFGRPIPLGNGADDVSYHYQLKPTDDFSPAFVSVNVVKSSFSGWNSDSVKRTDKKFLFSASFRSVYPLTDVFFVLAFETDDADHRLYVQEVRPQALQLGRPISIEASVPHDAPERYELHVFSQGLEVFHSGMSRTFIEEALAKMAAKRIAAITDAPAKPLAGPMPRYPEQLTKSKITGRAVVTCTIALNGQPTDVKIKTASDPAFAAAALAVMSEWWFVPRVEKGQPVISAAELPFDFVPPKS
jgi:TonB family protein